jgi:hypothetical protein
MFSDLKKQIAQCLGIEHIKGPARQRISPERINGGTTKNPLRTRFSRLGASPHQSWLAPPKTGSVL